MARAWLARGFRRLKFKFPSKLRRLLDRTQPKPGDETVLSQKRTWVAILLKDWLRYQQKSSKGGDGVPAFSMASCASFSISCGRVGKNESGVAIHRIVAKVIGISCRKTASKPMQLVFAYR
jgi:hypothetical protein